MVDPNTRFFIVYGKPEPAGSKRAFLHPSTGRPIVVDANRKAKPWKQEVAAAAAEARGDRELLTGPLRLSVWFFMARPKGHFRTGRHKGLLLDSAPTWHIVRPDATKLLRGLEDACTGVLWRDDAQIVNQHVEKLYGDIARCEIIVEALA